MNNTELNQYASSACGVLHHLYFDKPTPAFLANFRNGELLQCWPTFGSGADHKHALELVQQGLDNHSDDQLERDYYRLFIGPGKMHAYPWGSVYSDKQNLIFGDSCQAFQRFLQRWQVEVNLEQHQPHDHIGLMLGVLAQLLANDQRQAVDELLQDQLMPWAPRLLECIDIGANSDFYRGMAQLTAQLLTRLTEARQLTPANWPLYK